ncbi:type II toxin-antitoxin system VapC family toxin [Palleronia abyssalis]|uniref:Ribonuclease VapC n=1 Tax=Palleronia abyssalis TaxID=1501240 RepID=A0A2R8BZD4_9RHOB|nr:type II toxin-antitoxin system VapC family toxin [Palleronia abyssalis]SPJ25456.1 Toxin FitB [Palleronia abyssalis]
MILLDTNVLSEVMRPVPAPIVLEWFAAQSATDLYLPAIVEAELRFGLLLLPDGRRRSGLEAALNGMIDEDFAGRILPFDSTAAKAYPKIAARRRRAGKPVKEADCQIASIAASRGATLATRNVKDFTNSGVQIQNPWEPGP